MGQNQQIEQRAGLFAHLDKGPVFLRDELRGDGAIEVRQERIVIPGNVQKPARLPMQPELSPGHDFAKLFQRPVPAWECHKGVRQLSHQRLPLVHGPDNAEVRESAVGQLLVHERLGNHANDFAALCESGVGHDPHQTDVPTAIDEPKSAPGDGGAQFLRGPGEGREQTLVGAAKDTHSFHATILMGVSAPDESLDRESAGGDSAPLPVPCWNGAVFGLCSEHAGAL